MGTSQWSRLIKKWLRLTEKFGGYSDKLKSLTVVETD